jgi:pimeloyl-ACP methyl ester carboxylesterase
VTRWRQVGGLAAVLLIVVLAAAWGVGLVGGDPGQPPSATDGADDASPPPGPAEDDAERGDDPEDAEDLGELAPPEVTASVEVAQPTLWLCGPDAEDDACVGDLDATVVGADGARTVEPFTPAEDPPVDCFYVYPTVSQADTRNAPLEITSAEREVARVQAARFGEVCRVVAPVYRQVTVQGLLTGGFRDTEARDLAFGDVLSAFNDHVASSDRPFVLLGHSQGAQELTRLVAERIEGDPDLAPRLVSALLIGGEVTVPVGEDVGGSFATVPACRAPDQTGCVVAYNSFAETPPVFALFGRAGDGREVLCVNPAALDGGAAPLTPYLPTATVDGFATPFATAAGAVTGECRTEGAASWLQVDVDADLRAAADAGGADLGPAWGLHVGDVNLALGDLVELVRAQTAGLS